MEGGREGGTEGERGRRGRCKVVVDRTVGGKGKWKETLNNTLCKYNCKYNFFYNNAKQIGYG